MQAEPRAWRLVLVPAVITLVVTIVRLVGELCGWSPRLFSTASGGAGALVGISWLVPVFGAWFGFRLARAGAGPARPVRAVLLHVVAGVVYVGGFQVVIRVLNFDTSTRGGLVNQVLAMGTASLLAALVALIAWPRLFAVGLLYALLARLPVIAITWLAALNGWDTHHVKFGARDFAAFTPSEAATWLSCIQLVFWLPFTVAGGGLCGALAALLARKRGDLEVAAP